MAGDPLRPGDLVGGRYRIRRRLGVGGMSAVYLAADDVRGREVAVKVFPAALAQDGDDARRRDEVRLLARLSHPALVTLFDADLAAEPPFLTMERVVGETLADRLRRGPLTPTEFGTIAPVLTDALAHVHDEGILHRDVKPGNVLLPTTPTSTSAPAKLADFGIARLVDSESVTATGTMIGTAAYISPEQATGRAAGFASDVYALGIVFIEALTGVHPFPGTALESASARLARSPDLSGAALAPWRRLLERMTARDPEDRPTAERVHAELVGTAETAVWSVDTATAPMPVAAAVAMDTPRPALADVDGGAMDVRSGLDRRPAETAEPARTEPVPAHLLPHRSPPDRPPLRVRRPIIAAFVAAGVLIAGAGGGVAILGAQSAPTAPAAPEYPAVGGTLGDHLEMLQDGVAP